uniref:Uncharacterized protein n=1 Tax=Anopheles culicifacies TaxID=139723 RepID=A0A182M389_9DIPT
MVFSQVNGLIYVVNQLLVKLRNIQETTIVMIPNGNSKSEGAVLEKEMHHLAAAGNRTKGVVQRLATTHEMPSTDAGCDGADGNDTGGAGDCDQDLWPTKGATTGDRKPATVGFRLPPGRSAVRPRQACEMSKTRPVSGSSLAQQAPN